jgi:hypothetical protein
MHLHAAVNEQALRLLVGTEEVMCEQYEHLIAIAKRPNITLQVVVPERGPHQAVTGQFVVLEFEQVRPVVSPGDSIRFIADLMRGVSAATTGHVLRLPSAGRRSVFVTRRTLALVS